MSTPGRVLIVMPTYNEAGNIVAALLQVRRAAPWAHVLVVDGDSPDGAADVARELSNGDSGVLLGGGQKLGIGAAYRSGLRWGLGSGYDAVVQRDADLSHPPEMIPDLVAALAHADVVVGSRYVAGGRVRNWKGSRRALSRLGNAYVRSVLRVPVLDATAGFKAFRAQALRDIGVLDSLSNGYCFQIETTWRADRAGLRIVELAITFVDRERGTSKMSGDIAIEAVVRVLAWRWSELTATTRGGNRRHGVTGSSASGHSVA